MDQYTAPSRAPKELGNQEIPVGTPLGSLSSRLASRSQWYQGSQGSQGSPRLPPISPRNGLANSPW